MEELDFSILTDDQLVALVRAGCAEAVSRGAAPAAAAYDVYQDARMAAEEKARREQAALETAKQWRIRKGIAQEAERLFGGCGFRTSDLRVVVWRKADDQRVFIQYKYDETIFTSYVTGSLRRSVLPEHCDWGTDADLCANKLQIMAFCKAVAETLPEANIIIGAALKYPEEAIPLGHGYEPQPLAGEKAPGAEVAP